MKLINSDLISSQRKTNRKKYSLSKYMISRKKRNYRSLTIINRKMTDNFKLINK